MCPSGKVKVFSPGDTCFAGELGTFDAGTAPVAGAPGAAVDVDATVSVAVRSAVLLSAGFEAAAGVPVCVAQPARARLTANPAMATVAAKAVRLEFIV
ncbi:hypothetical protein NicSoilB4_20950 [Arthrobacter sp. NicSoilB4]|nr:hypothetical protein NicSoilB4_20950 [Arthrobacter sp. NicSoilB4]